MQLIKRIKEIFSKQTQQKDYVCIVFKNDDRYFFQEVCTEEQTDHFLLPILVELELLGMVEEDIIKVQMWCQANYGIEASERKIKISYNVLSLAPIRIENYYLAIVDVNGEALKKLRKFRFVNRTDILLKRDSNIFFDLVAKEIE